MSCLHEWLYTTTRKIKNKKKNNIGVPLYQKGGWAFIKFKSCVKIRF